MQAVAKDLEHYAGDEPPPGWSLNTEIDGVLREADARGWESFHLAGYSGGGSAVLAFADKHPNRLLSLAMLEPAWAGSWIWSPAHAELWQAFGRLAAFSKPVLFVLGGRSNPDQFGGIVERLSTVFPDFRLEVFADRHHFDPPHRVEPERLARCCVGTGTAPKDGITPPSAESLAQPPEGGAGHVAGRWATGPPPRKSSPHRRLIESKSALTRSTGPAIPAGTRPGPT